jgi:uncharacterized membrane-anchored protein
MLEADGITRQIFDTIDGHFAESATVYGLYRLLITSVSDGLPVVTLCHFSS